MIRIEEADARALGSWDAWVRASINGTLYHELGFLAYHGDRFAGRERHLVAFDGGAPRALISLALDVDGEGRRRARSPYGGSYGGFVLLDAPSYELSRAIAGAFVEYLAELETATCSLTFPIACCERAPLDTFRFALLEAGFASTNRDISSVVLLDPARPAIEQIAPRARRNVHKAERAGVEVRHRAPLDDFWRTADETFRRHGAAPTHDRDQLAWLARALPERVYADVAYLGGAPLASLVHFVVNDRVDCSFYLCETDAHRDLQAMTLVIEQALERARLAGFAAFDLGTSSAGMQARPSVFFFKEGFTRAGQFRETLSWSAAPRTPGQGR